MSENINEELGVVKVATDVIAAYIYHAVINTIGVAGFAGGLSDAISQTILGKESKYKGIKIDDGENGYEIDIYVVVEFGCKIPAVAWAIQKNVKNSLEEIMFLDIENININIQGVSIIDGHKITDDEPAFDPEVFDEIKNPGEEK